MSNNSGKKLEKNLEPIFNMHERFDEALYRANIKKERIIHLPFKQFIGILASCCLAFSATTVAVTQYVASFSQSEITYNREDLELAQGYFYKNKIDFSKKSPTSTNYINDDFAFNTFNPNTNNHYYQIYKITEKSKAKTLNLTFICNNQSKSFDIDITQKNYIEKINDDNFTISGDYYTCEISVNNSFYKKIYLNL